MCHFLVVPATTKPETDIFYDRSHVDAEALCYTCGLTIIDEVSPQIALLAVEDHLRWHAWLRDAKPIAPLQPHCFCFIDLTSTLSDEELSREMAAREDLEIAVRQGDSGAVGGQPSEALVRYEALVANPAFLAVSPGSEDSARGEVGW